MPPRILPDAIFLEPDMDEAPRTSRLTRLWSHARPYRGAFALGFALLLVTNALALAIPWLLRDAIHALERRESAGTVAWYAGAMAALALGQAVARTFSRLTILGASRRIVYDLRNQFFAQLQRLSASWYDTHRTGDVMSRGVNDVQILQSLYGPGLLNVVNTAIVYVAVVALLLGIDPALTAVSLSLFPPLYFGVNRISRRVYARSLQVQQQLGEISNRAQENLSGIQQVKIYAQEAREIEGFRELNAVFRESNLALSRVRGAMVSLIGVVAGLATLLVLFVGGLHVIRGRMSFGDFVAFNAYLGSLAWPTVALGWIVNVFQRGAGALDRLDEVLEAQPDVPPSADEKGEDLAPLSGTLEIRHLSFAYAPGGPPALHDVSLTIPEGSRIALVGPVGSGKSTLANLLARVYPVPRGTIFVGGTDVNDLSVSRLRRSLGYVPQEAFLFSKPLRDNIALGRPAASEDELVRAVRLSHLAADLDAFPEGLDTVVGERGFTLSGGQRQRATLARAAVPEPRILVLDDALSSVDADTEKAILGELQQGLAGRTLILISHRLSTLAGVDRIVVLEGGRVVEDGTHGELMRRGGLYARLFQRGQLEERLDTTA
ncbi:MAG TPA: ABC transporter ATP-binding protein [Candidatus Polarisedimenticolaceae bacterium]|nr:ABC transporter ATP-binding protein [Candidatus Polarisedimenticolaceae bacterium]